MGAPRMPAGSVASAGLPASIAPPPAVMDAPAGPVCGCGQPSAHESGWCGRKICPVHCPLTVDEIARRGRIGQAVCVFGALCDDDQRVWLDMLKGGGDFASLVARCQEITDTGREPAGTPSNYRATSREDVALGSLLSALRDRRLLVLGPGRRDR